MHRMRRFSVLLGLITTSCMLVSAGSASASLLKPDAGRAYPDIAADINGTVTYTYDSSTQTGNFFVKNTPYLLAAGSTSNTEFSVLPNADTGIRSQQISVALDKSGNFLPSDTNSYALYGTINANGQTYSGLLLQGKPTAFGSQDLGPVGVSGSDIFDVNVDITGGALASFFGKSAYMRITPELNSTFTGVFDQNFSAAKATSNTRSYNQPLPFPVPEPSTFVVMAMGLGGLAMRARRRKLNR